MKIPQVFSLQILSKTSKKKKRPIFNPQPHLSFNRWFTISSANLFEKLASWEMASKTKGRSKRSPKTLTQNSGRYLRKCKKYSLFQRTLYTKREWESATRHSTIFLKEWLTIQTTDVWWLTRGLISSGKVLKHFGKRFTPKYRMRRMWMVINILWH